MGAKPERKSAAMRKPLLSLLATVFILSTLFGCATARKWSPEEHSYPEACMFLEPGDTLEISFLGAPELNSTQKIRRDGFIAMRLMGDVRAAGKTPDMLRKELERLYAAQLQIKEVSVYVRSSGPVYVGGSVNEPGEISMEHPITALEAIMKAGGFDPVTAEVAKVVVVRHISGKQSTYELNFKPVLNGKEGFPFYLKPYDIVYVPRTGIAKVNQAVQQYINNMLPRLGVGYTTEGEVTVYR